MENSVISKFLYKLLFLTLIFFLIVFLDAKSLINMDKIKDRLNENINFIEIIKKVNGELNIINLEENIVSVSKNDEKVIKINNNTNKYYTKTNKVYSKSLGSVVKIVKENDLYTVYIQDEFKNIFIYKDLSDINVKMYQIIKYNEELGVANKINNDDKINYYYYYYLLTINEN